METRTYTERSNARRAARAFGVDPESITETEDGFTFPLPSQEQMIERLDTTIKNGNVADAAPITAAPETAKPVDGLDIPDFLKLSPEQRKESWIKNPPKVALAKWKEDVAMTKAKAKAKKTKGKSGSDKTALLLSMLKGKGSTVEQLTKALDWLPHTLRARISRLPKDDKKIKIERERVDGVTSYRIAS